LLGESTDHLDRLLTLREAGSIVGPKVHDARIAAICLSPPNLTNDHGQ
jgi:uncharacterized protein